MWAGVSMIAKSFKARLLAVSQKLVTLKLLLFNFQRHRRSPSLWNHLLPTALLLLIFGSGVSGQCFGGVETYEKTAGTTVICSAADGCNSRGLLTQPDPSVTRDCIAICKQSSACNVFTVGEIFITLSLCLFLFSIPGLFLFIFVFSIQLILHK